MVEIYQLIQKIQSTATRIVGLNCYVHLWVPLDSQVLCLEIGARYKGKCYDITHKFNFETMRSIEYPEVFIEVYVVGMAKSIRQYFMEDMIK